MATNALASEPTDQRANRSYITMVTSDGFIVGALTLHQSLRLVKSKYSLAALVTESVSSAARKALQEDGINVILVEPIPYPSYPSHVPSWNQVGLTKLRIWQLSNLYSKVVYIDADAIALKNVDGLFDINLTRGVDGHPLAAAPDLFPPDRFNAGVLVTEPDERVFVELMRRAGECIETYDGGDTGFLNNVFDDWHHWPASNRLSFGFNAQRTMHWFTKKNERYWDIGVGEKNLHIIHYSSSPKPWEIPKVDKRRSDKLEQLWWQIHNKRGNGEATIKGQTFSDMNMGREKTELKRMTTHIHSVEFAVSMTARKVRFGCWSDPERDAKWLRSLQQLFERNKLLHTNPGRHQIPKIIHQIWFGPKNLPKSFTDTYQHTWKSLHPGWKYVLWTDEDIISRPDILQHCRKQMKDAATPVEKSDIWRLAVLFELGGVYVDIDFEAVSSLESLRQRFSLFAGISNTGTVEINNALIGSVPKHPMIENCLNSIKLSKECNAEGVFQSDAMKIISRTGPGHFTRCFMEFVESIAEVNQSTHDEKGNSGNEQCIMRNIIALPCGFLYPFPNHLRSMKSRGDRMIFVRPETLAMHHWESSWQECKKRERKTFDADINQAEYIRRHVIGEVVHMLNAHNADEKNRTHASSRPENERGCEGQRKTVEIPREQQQRETKSLDEVDEGQCKVDTSSEELGNKTEIPKAALDRITFFLGLSHPS